MNSVGPDHVCSIGSQVIWTVLISKRCVDLKRANMMQIHWPRAIVDWCSNIDKIQAGIVTHNYAQIYFRVCHIFCPFILTITSRIKNSNMNQKT